MMLMCFMFLVLLSIFSIFLSSSPFLISIFLIFFSFFISLALGYLGLSWFFYSLFIMFLGGMMVVFIYASSISTIFKLNNLLKYMNYKMLTYFLLLSFFSDLFFQKSCMIFTNFNSFSSSYLMMIISFILLCLFIIVKMVAIQEGPLKI